MLLVMRSNHGQTNFTVNGKSDHVLDAPEISFTIQDNYVAKEGQKRSFECMDQAKSYPTPTLVIEKLGK